MELNREGKRLEGAFLLSSINMLLLFAFVITGIEKVLFGIFVASLPPIVFTFLYGIKKTKR